LELLCFIAVSEDQATQHTMLVLIQCIATILPVPPPIALTQLHDLHINMNTPLCLTNSL